MNDASKNVARCADQYVRIQIPEQIRQLIERQADDPHGRRAPKPRKNQLGQNRLDLEQEKSAQENSYRVQPYREVRRIFSLGSKRLFVGVGEHGQAVQCTSPGRAETTQPFPPRAPRK